MQSVAVLEFHEPRKDTRDFSREFPCGVHEIDAANAMKIKVVRNFLADIFDTSVKFCA